MSKKLSFREALDRPDEIAAAPRVSSDFPVYDLALLAGGAIEQPIDVIRLLVKHGLSLKKARQTLDRLATGSPVVVELRTDALSELQTTLSRCGVEAFVLENPKVDAKTVREKQGLSQYDFALLYGLEVDTLKNWEQGRNAPDGPARVLLSVIERCPHAVIEARTTLRFSRRPEYRVTYDFPLAKSARQISTD
jgi:DNA-binding transcriptional regulator YiaG